MLLGGRDSDVTVEQYCIRRYLAGNPHVAARSKAPGRDSRGFALTDCVGYGSVAQYKKVDVSFREVTTAHRSTGFYHERSRTQNLDLLPTPFSSSSLSAPPAMVGTPHN